MLQSPLPASSDVRVGIVLPEPLEMPRARPRPWNCQVGGAACQTSWGPHVGRGLNLARNADVSNGAWGEGQGLR